jgi:hypothetical protein
MLGWFKKQPNSPPPAPRVASQPAGEVFPSPKGWRLTAVDEVVLLVPAQILSDDEPIGSVIRCDDGVKLRLPTVPLDSPDARIFVWLQPGQSVWLTKSCQAMVVPNDEQDKAVRRLRVSQVPEGSE